MIFVPVTAAPNSRYLVITGDSRSGNHPSAATASAELSKMGPKPASRILRSYDDDFIHYIGELYSDIRVHAPQFPVSNPSTKTEQVKVHPGVPPSFQK